MASSAHPTPHRLAQLAEGVVGAAARAGLERHVAECARCSGELRRLAAVIARLSQPAPADGVVRRLSALLAFDSARSLAAFGGRRPHLGTARQIRFEAGPFEVEMHASAARSGLAIQGQVLGPTDAQSGEIVLDGQRGSMRAALTQLLEFTLQGVAFGVYRADVQLGQTLHIEIGHLDLLSL